MLKIICSEKQKEEIKQYFTKTMAEIVTDTDLEALAFSHYDGDELEENILSLIEDTHTGFIFDKENMTGTEPYGYVYDFFECYLSFVKDLKEKFPNIGIDGDICVYEYGVMDSVYTQRVYCTPKMKKVKFIDQSQCIKCEEWIDVKDAAKTFEDGDSEIYDYVEDFCMTPSGYFSGKRQAAFCLCKKCTKEEENA